MAARREWERLIEEQRESGKSVAAFCRERGVSDKSFGYWEKRLCSAGAGSGRFATVGDGSKIELHFRSGVSVRVPRDITGAEIRRIVEALRC